MMKKIFNLFAVFIIFLCCVACDDKGNKTEFTEKEWGENPLRLWYDEEAPKDHEGNAATDWWADTYGKNDFGWTNWSLPIGNGYFGVSTFGRTETERLTIADKTLYNPEQQKEAPYAIIGGLNVFSETYIDFNHTNSEVTNYQRYLDIENAISGVQYDYDGVKYKREYFTSYPDKALVIYLEASETASLDFTLRPTVPFEKDYELTPNDNFSKRGQVNSSVEGGVGTIELTGYMGYYGIDFMALYKVYTDDGEVVASTVEEEISENDNGGSHSEVGDGTIVVEGATRACIVVTLGTDYELESGIFDVERWNTQHDRNRPTMYRTFEYTKNKVLGYFDDIEKLIHNKNVMDTYSILKDRHLEDYKEMFDRVEFNLDLDPTDIEMTTDELFEAVQIGYDSAYFDQLFFQYGRYLLIAASRPGTMPSHLQGAWNCFDIPEWGANHTHNINAQMNYWPAFSTNLAETFEPYVEFNKAYMTQANKTASALIYENNREMYNKDGGNGWTIGVLNTGFFITEDASPGNMGFTTQLFWDYYRYTKDPEVLETIYNVLVEAARYITKCVKEYEGGYYLVEYSDSPEQWVNGVWYRTVGTTYAQSASYMNNYNTLLAAKELGIDIENNGVLSNEEYSILKRILEQLDKYDPINVGLSGQIKEFREENYYGELGEYDHRHISHLIGLYPGNIINSETPAWMDAAEVTLQYRDGYAEGGAWPHAHKMNLYARIKDGDSAYNEFRKMITSATGQNLWTKYKYIYQAEANYGATAGIAEMLLQSHEGYIEPLAALPSNWTSGSYSGLVAEGNFEVGCGWDNSLADYINITSKLGGSVKVKYPSITNAKVVDSKGNEISYEVVGNDIISFETEKGETYKITGFVKVNTPNAPTNFTYTREDLGEYTFVWDSVSTATKYNIYKAVENDSTYTLIGTTTSNSFTYMPNEAETNLRTTFVVAAVNKDGREGKRTLCYYNPIAVEATINKVDWRLTSNGGIKFVIESNENAILYRLYEKTAGSSDFIKVDEGTSNILRAAVYHKDSEYAVQTVSKFDNKESDLYVIDKNYNVLDNKKFVPTEEALGLLWDNNHGYKNLTDGVFAEGEGRYSSTADTGMFEATVDLEEKYIINELKLYPYAQMVEYIGSDLLVEVYNDGSWTTALKINSNAEMAKYKVEASTNAGYDYFLFDLNGIEAEKVRIKINATLPTYSISFYEIEILGYTEIVESGIENVFANKEFIPTTEASNNIWDSNHSYKTLTDGIFAESGGRFSTKGNWENNISSVDATIDLDGSCSLNELRVYYYINWDKVDKENGYLDTSYLGNDLKIEVYNNGVWTTVANYSQSDFANHLVSKGPGIGNSWLQINLDSITAQKIRISSTGALPNTSISFYEIECYGIVN